MPSRMKSKGVDPSDRLIVALGEYDTGWHEPVQSLARARVVAQQARAAGADLLVLPEMCASGFTMDADSFAEPPGSRINATSWRSTGRAKVTGWSTAAAR